MITALFFPLISSKISNHPRQVLDFHRGINRLNQNQPLSLLPFSPLPVQSNPLVFSSQRYPLNERESHKYLGPLQSHPWSFRGSEWQSPFPLQQYIKKTWLADIGLPNDGTGDPFTKDPSFLHKRDPFLYRLNHPLMSLFNSPKAMGSISSSGKSIWASIKPNAHRFALSPHFFK